MNEPSNRFLAVGSGVRVHPLWRAIPVVLVSSFSALTLLRYWSSSDPYPPGLDGAQWLSYGRAEFGGPGRGAESTYAPLIPALAHGLSLVLGPYLGLRVLAVSLLAVLALAVSLLAVLVLGLTWGSLTAALVLPSTALAEPFYYGGYPQQAALAFGILGIVGLLRANCARSVPGQTCAFAITAICLSLASASHLLFGPLLLLSASLVALAMGMARNVRSSFLLRAAMALAPAAAVSLFVWVTFLDHGYGAPLAVSHRTLRDAWVYATRESPWLWAAIVVGGILSSSLIVMRNWPAVTLAHGFNPPSLAVVVGFALVGPGTVLLVASGQPRLAPPVLLGGAILAGFTCSTTTRAWTNARLPVLSAWCLAIFWLAGITTGLVREFGHFYQVLDASLVTAAQRIPSSSTGAVAVAPDRRGWPVGWWIEALRETPVFTGSNPQWLAFPEERARAEEVDALLASPRASVLQERARDLEVEYLLLRKWEWIGWERWIDGTPDVPTVIYDDNETMVFRIASPTS